MLKHHIHGTAAFHHIATDIAHQPDVGVGIHEDLQVHHVAQFLIVQGHDTLDDDDGLGIHMDGLLQTVTLYIGIGGLFDGLAVLEFLDLLRQQFPVEGIGMVEVDLPALLRCQACRIVIIRVKGHYRCTVRGQRLSNLFHHGGLS